MTYKKSFDLCGECQLTGENGQNYDATVPGCVHTDIIKDNMYWRDNSKNVQDIENHNWKYSKEFTVDEIFDNAYIVFEGLDTYCDIYLNDIKIGECANMFVSHRIKADNALKIGKNVLAVYFYSPIKKAAELPKKNGAFTTERLNTRRMQCTYGWDWVERFVTCGIFRPVYLVFDNNFRIDNVYVFTESVDKYGASVKISGETANYVEGAPVTISISAPNGEIIYEKTEYINSRYFEETVNISNPELWYPNGYGNQPIYTLRFEYDRICKEEKFGIRTVRIVEIEDKIGSEYYNICEEIKKTPSALEYDANKKYSGFILYINGIEIMCKGANFVPTEPFISEEKDEKITKLLEMSKDAGVNMLRIWGGGIFESDWFYSECDRLGITVTQDFMMACGEYPEDEEWFINELRKETEYAAKKLRNHPCLVWWSGDNENAINGTYTDKNYQGKRAFYNGILPELQRYDYSHRVFASSPYGGNKFASKTVGTTHNTQYLSYIFNYITDTDMSDYKEYFDLYTARFIAEEPTGGMVCEQSLREMMTEDDMYDSEMKMAYWHTRSNPALEHEVMDYIVAFAEKVLGKFENPKDRLFKLRYVQYEWVRISLENARNRNGFCNGIIYWMLNDCWPAATGWAFIDYYCRPKASYYSFKRAAKPVISIVKCKNDKFEIVISNNGIYDKLVNVKCKIINYMTNEENVVFETKINSPKNNSVCFEVNAELAETDIFICDLDNGTTDRSFYKNGKLELSHCHDVEIINSTETEIEICASKYTHTVELVGDCIFDENYFSMTKGERKIIRHTNCKDIQLNAYTLK